MSGGSYEYLCFTEIQDLLHKEDIITKMADRLIELGYDNFAKETLQILYDIKKFKLSFEVREIRLSSIWKAVEWLDSGDYGIDTAKECLDEINIKENKIKLEEEYITRKEYKEHIKEISNLLKERGMKWKKTNQK